MKTTRLFLILDVLRSARLPVTAKSLAARFDVTERTIYRDLATLQAIGAPVHGEAGIGYQLEAGFFLPPLRFDSDELDAVRFGLQLMIAKGDQTLQQAAERVAGKIAAILAAQARSDFLEAPLLAQSRVDRATLDAGNRLLKLRVAIKRRLTVSLHYLDLKGQRTERSCRPIGLTVFDGAWLLTSWCELRHDFRNMRVDRIESVVPTGRNFRPERGKRFDDYLRTLVKAQ